MEFRPRWHHRSCLWCPPVHDLRRHVVTEWLYVKRTATGRQCDNPRPRMATVEPTSSAVVDESSSSRLRDPLQNAERNPKGTFVAAIDQRRAPIELAIHCLPDDTRGAISKEFPSLIFQL